MNWSPSQRIEATYTRSLKNLINSYTRFVKRARTAREIIETLSYQEKQSIIQLIHELRRQGRSREEIAASLGEIQGRLFVAASQEVKNLIPELLLTQFDPLNPYDIIKGFQSFFQTKEVTDFAHAAASRMITGLAVENARTWREAASESMQGARNYRLLMQELEGRTGARIEQMVADNARLISSFPEDIAPRVNDYIMEETYKGRRADAIADDLIEQFPAMSRSRTQLIARTETSKASTALTRSRSEDLGLDWYVWRTSKDQRVRDSHRKMDAVICNWNDPPNPEKLNGEKRTYGSHDPGDIFNCRCYPEPLLRLDAVRWPHKVHVSGSIHMLRRSEFERLAGANMRIAA